MRPIRVVRDRVMPINDNSKLLEQCAKDPVVNWTRGWYSKFGGWDANMPVVSRFYGIVGRAKIGMEKSPGLLSPIKIVTKNESAHCIQQNQRWVDALRQFRNLCLLGIHTGMGTRVSKANHIEQRLCYGGILDFVRHLLSVNVWTIYTITERPHHFISSYHPHIGSPPMIVVLLEIH